MGIGNVFFKKYIFEKFRCFDFFQLQSILKFVAVSFSYIKEWSCKASIFSEKNLGILVGNRNEGYCFFLEKKSYSCSFTKAIF